MVVNPTVMTGGESPNLEIFKKQSPQKESQVFMFFPCDTDAPGTQMTRLQKALFWGVDLQK